MVNYLNKQGHTGWRADCIGPEGCYQGVINNAEKFEDDFWINEHVSFESYWWLGEWKRKEWDVDTIINRLLNLHVSTFNAKSLPIPWEWKDKIDCFVSKMGYHFVIREVETSDAVKAGHPLSISIEIENVGVAPIYYPIPLFIKIKNMITRHCFRSM